MTDTVQNDKSSWASRNIWQVNIDKSCLKVTIPSRRHHCLLKTFSVLSWILWAVSTLRDAALTICLCVLSLVRMSLENLAKVILRRRWSKITCRHSQSSPSALSCGGCVSLKAAPRKVPATGHLLLAPFEGLGDVKLCTGKDVPRKPLDVTPAATSLVGSLTWGCVG